MKIIEKIVMKMQGNSKSQKRFICVLLSTLFIVRGRATFRNLSRYSLKSEKTYSRQYERPFDFILLNRELIKEAIGTESERIIAFDPSFVPKSGKSTYGRDSFWHGSHSRPEKGLEISLVSIVDIEINTGMGLSVRQTVPSKRRESAERTLRETAGENKNPKSKSGNGVNSKKGSRLWNKKKESVYRQEDETQIDGYLCHIVSVREYLLPNEKYLAADGGLSSKKKFVDGVLGMGLHVVGKLRHDANMKFFYVGAKREKGSGRQKVYGGKVNWQDLSGFEYAGMNDGLELYSHILYHVGLKRRIRVVVAVMRNKESKVRYVILYSTDIELAPEKIFRYYKARFQIEFIFRDAKQFTGLCHCQARDQKRLDFHFNASVSALNGAKAELIQAHVDRGNGKPMTLSIAGAKVRYFNKFYLSLIISMLGFDQSLIEKLPDFQKLMQLGAMAA